jgi:predicted dehydrogenase
MTDARPAVPSARYTVISAALIGAGRMGTYHARLARRAGITIRSVSDVSAARARTVAASLGAEVSWHDLSDDALAVPAIEACLVVSPTNTHEAVVRSALGRGLHVFCEKPLTLDPDHDQRLGELAAQCGRILQVGFWRRFSSPWVAAARTFQSGRIGHLESYRGVLWDATLPPSQFHDRTVSGGLIVDCGVHDFDCIEWLTGERIEWVEAQHLPYAEPSVATTGDVDNALVLLGLESGAAGVIELSRNARYADDMRLELLGSDGALFVDTYPTARARLGTRAGLAEIQGSRVPDAFEAGIIGELQVFAADARGMTAIVPDASTSARALKIALAARLSADTGTRQAVAAP